MMAPWCLIAACIPASLAAQAPTPQASDQTVLENPAARDVTSSGLALLEVRTERASYFIGEPIRVVLRFGFEQEFLNSNLVALFRPPMDLPVQIVAPWIEQLPGATRVATANDAAQGTQRFVLNESLSHARPVDGLAVGGKPMKSFELERTFIAESAGTLKLPQARLRFAFATRFGEALFQDSVAEDRAEAYVLSSARTLEILPLPEIDRPAGFSGAVGRLSLRTEVSAREIDHGASLKLTLHIEGDGNLAGFAVPRLEFAEGWRVFGAIDHSSPRLRSIEYDLAPMRAGEVRVPQIEFAYFDPSPPAQYRSLQSESIQVLVRASGGSTPTTKLPEKPAASATNWIPWLIGVLIAAALTAAVTLRRRKAQRAT